jgi:hypothetical protein
MTMTVRNIPQTILLLLFYICFIMANFLLLAWPFYITMGVLKNAGILVDLLIIAAPLLVMFLSALTQELVSSSNHLKYWLFLVFVSVVNAANYLHMCHKMIVSPDINSHVSSPVPFKAVFETLAIFSIIGAGPTGIMLFLASEAVYFRIIRVCCQDIGSYGTFWSKLYQHIGDIGDHVADSASGIAVIVRVCFWDSESNCDSEESGGHRTANQASLPPPYWVSPLLFDHVLFHGSLYFRFT